MAKVTIQAPTRVYMSLAPAMPEVKLTAVVEGAPDPGPAAFTWRFSLAYPDFLATPGGVRRNVRTKTHPPMAPVQGNPATVPLTVLMCGRLTASVEVMVAGARLTAQRDDILIGGSNPAPVDLAAEVPVRLMRQMIQQESGAKQFSDSAAGAWTSEAVNPNWSGDNLRGVGLGQLTVPPPSDDDIWNWRINARDLQERFRGKRASASTLHTRIMATARFATEVQALNAWRRAEGQPPVAVTLPQLTAEQQDWEGLRAYNGFGVRLTDQYLDYIHEFEPARARLTSTARKGPDGKPLVSPPLLAVDAAGRGSWSQISGAERRRRSGGSAPGDPDYVAHVLAKHG